MYNWQTKHNRHSSNRDYESNIHISLWKCYQNAFKCQNYLKLFCTLKMKWIAAVLVVSAETSHECARLRSVDMKHVLAQKRTTATFHPGDQPVGKTPTCWVYNMSVLKTKPGSCWPVFRLNLQRYISDSCWIIIILFDLKQRSQNSLKCCLMWFRLNKIHEKCLTGDIY